MKQDQHPIEMRIQLAHALYKQRRYMEAVAVLDGVLEIRPDHAGVWNDRGIMLRTLTRFNSALDSYDKAIELAPCYWEAHYNRGATLDLLSRHGEALTSYDNALAIKPDIAPAWNNRGSALLSLGRAEEAVGSYGRAIALSPSYAEAFGNRAAALTQLGRHNEALASADAAIKLQYAVAVFHDHRGTALANLHRPAEALLSYDRAIQPEILDGLAKLKLDPKRIKYVILSHAHGDHDQGVAALHSRFGAKVVMGGPDWDVTLKRAPDVAGGVPTRGPGDITVGSEGTKVTLGDTTVNIVSTPGHTPGTLSYIFPVKDKVRPVMVAYSGGTLTGAFGADGKRWDEYIDSQKRMAKAAAGASVILFNHSEYDNAYTKARLVAVKREVGEKNPFIMGPESVQNYFTVIEECATASKLRNGVK
jgi:glyoxylase-like metal-dependent hydrolase (beta-lactamase superfamily II)/regulator of sirC expression with transglutaminase-like and TPR domain